MLLKLEQFAKPWHKSLLCWIHVMSCRTFSTLSRTSNVRGWGQRFFQWYIFRAVNDRKRNKLQCERLKEIINNCPKVFTFCLAIFVSGKVCGVTKKPCFWWTHEPKPILFHLLTDCSLSNTYDISFLWFHWGWGFFSFQSPIYTTCKPCHFHEFLPSKVNKRGGNSECVEMIVVSIQQAEFIYEAWQAVDMPWI